MSGSGKGLIGLWLYRNNEEWTMQQSSAVKEICNKNMRDISAGHGNNSAAISACRASVNSVVFSLKNKVGGLAVALQVFKERGLNVVHIESRKSKRRNSEFEILVDLECDDGEMKELTTILQKEVSCLALHEYENGKEFPVQHPSRLPPQESFDFGDMCVWFPRKIGDLDYFQTVLMYGSDLQSDHPGFTDPVYRERRKFFYNIAMNYKFGQPIPRVKYTDEETETWGVIFRELQKMYPKYACKEYNHNWPMLVKNCGYREDNVPQLADIEKYLRSKTGFSLRPVAGYLSPRDFLAGLAFRVFHCTQYIRHSSDPFYTPEPDCCHELLGHMPLFACPSFAQFSQEIGLASLGANDEELMKIATDDKLRVYGAGLLSSIAELRHCLTDDAKVFPFNPEEVAKVDCLVTMFQNQYFYTDTFEEAKEKLRTYLKNSRRPFGVRYNPYTHSVDILSNTEKIAALVSELKGDLCIVRNALQKIQENDDSANIESLTSELASALKGEEKPEKF